MIRTNQTHTLQTNTRLHEEEPQNTHSHKTSGIQLKQSNHLSLPRQDDCKTRNDTYKCRTNRRLTQNPHKQCEVHETIALQYRTFTLAITTYDILETDQKLLSRASTQNNHSCKALIDQCSNATISITKTDKWSQKLWPLY